MTPMRGQTPLTRNGRPNKGDNDQREKPEMKTKLNLLKGAAVAALLSTGSAAYAECGTVSVTEMNWPSSQIITHVSKFLMEQG